MLRPSGVRAIFVCFASGNPGGSPCTASVFAFSSLSLRFLLLAGLGTIGGSGNGLGWRRAGSPSGHIWFLGQACIDEGRRSHEISLPALQIIHCELNGCLEVLSVIGNLSAGELAHAHVVFEHRLPSSPGGATVSVQVVGSHSVTEKVVGVAEPPVVC